MIRLSHGIRAAGFTMVELIVTMIVLGIMAIAIVPRFADRLVFDTRGFVDQTRAAIEFGRKVAVATGRNVCVTASGTSLALTMATLRGQSAACSPAVINPAGGAYSLSAPSGVSYSTSLNPMTFHADGTPSAAGSLTVQGDGTTTINVAASGHVY